MGSDISKPHRYAAFISYAHADEIMAARLHKALETYPVPKHLRALGKTTKPVFRDVAELTAAHSLSEKIRDAVEGSRVLIVLCSPAAKASHWVNEEIRLFRKLHGDASILSAIIEGTPETAFPKALIKGGREPLAAALGTDKAGFRLGVTQLAAGMLGTGLDELVQRGAKRRQRIMGAGLAASLALSGVMGFTALQAVEARNEAEQSRNDAEGLVEYMITDLKQNLQPIRKLDILEGVGGEVVSYYEKQDRSKMPDERLLRQAEALHLLGDVALDSGRFEDAKREFETALTITQAVLDRNSDDLNVIYAHAQSEFWMGEFYIKQKQYDAAKPYWEAYNDFGQQLYEADPASFKWIMEAGWGANNLGALENHLLNFEASRNQFNEAIQKFGAAIDISPHSKSAKKELANAYAGAARSELLGGTKDEALSFRLKQIDVYANLIKNHPQDMNLKYRNAKAKDRLLRDFQPEEVDLDLETLDKDMRDSLFSLVRFDTENQDWQATLFQDSFRRLYKAQILANIEDTSDVFSGFLTHKKNYFAAASSSNLQDKFYNDLTPVFFELNQKNKLGALKELNSVNHKYELAQGDPIYLLEVYRTMWMLNRFFDQDVEARKFADLFLIYISENSASILPNLERDRIKILWYLGQKKEARLFNRALSNRGFRPVKL